jgi:hypothetical protein
MNIFMLQQYDSGFCFITGLQIDNDLEISLINSSKMGQGKQ